MLQQLSLEAFLALSKTSKRVAVYHEISADRLTPIGIATCLSSEMRNGVILESGLHHQDAGRYSFITFDPIAQLTVQNGRVLRRVGDETITCDTHPFTALRQLLSELSCQTQHQSAECIHGAVGFITYDAIRLFEAIPNQHVSENPLPDMLFNFYRTALVFDHLQQKLHISTVVEVGEDLKQIYQDAQEKISALVKKISTPIQNNPETPAKTQNAFPTEVDVSDDAFMQLVKEAKRYIINGDAFQIVLSRCFKKQYRTSPFNIYRALRSISPAPYMFYFPFEDNFILGASPEKLIQVRDGEVTINPIAGTRRRTQQRQDEEIAQELLNDPKEHAEHMMLVDLARNDLGAVCQPGSVTVSNLLQVKHFSHVSHITSEVTGQLSENKDALDALAAVFPAGTLSGAPKIRAMQIVDELETSKRGMYGGAICRLDAQGNLDSCIAIRMAVLRDGVATVRTGAGIVYDSDPQSEANETRQKAQGVLDAITFAEGLA